MGFKRLRPFTRELTSVKDNAAVCRRPRRLSLRRVMRWPSPWHNRPVQGTKGTNLGHGVSRPLRPGSASGDVVLSE
jgi:hypothetical protein